MSAADRLPAARIPAERFRALFEPRGVLVAGASTHPGKFGFVSLHNILACGYEGKVFATNRDGAEVLGIQTVADIDELPDGEIDLVFVCTPAAANPDVLRACAKKGITAAFIASAGYGEAGEAGIAAQADLVVGTTVTLLGAIEGDAVLRFTSEKVWLLRVGGTLVVSDDPSHLDGTGAADGATLLMAAMMLLRETSTHLAAERRTDDEDHGGPAEGEVH